MTTADMAVAAMQAGLRGERLPDMGIKKLTPEQLLLVNRVYDEARNWGASKAVKERG